MSNEDAVRDRPGWINWLMWIWTSILELVYHIMAELSDKLMGIASKSLPIAAPLPNAISVYHLSQSVMGYDIWQAAAFALTLELFLFAVVEISLVAWAGFLNDRDRYTVPLFAMIGVTAAALAIVVTIVYQVEITNGGNYVMALLPFISICAFVAIGMRNLDEKWKSEAEAPKRKPRATTGKVQEITTSDKGNSIEAMNEAKARKIKERQMEIAEIVRGNFPISAADISKLLTNPVSARTVTNDLVEIAEEAQLKRENGKWSPDVPIEHAVEFSMNGVAH